ncbi:hypothetical protein ACCO45_008899 [Purpureocillium lilacinum]|uniref:Uncharacterized protein n=1 Tax=Purpureocillium lilacinum TaxID=33203 RepID=A0ACC4DIZ1_PURLI
MKRKLDQNDVPSPGPKEEKPTAKPKVADEDLTFADLGLDPRLVQAVAEQSFLKPTLVQRKAIPLAPEWAGCSVQGQDGLRQDCGLRSPRARWYPEAQSYGPERIDSGTHPCPDAGTLRSGCPGREADRQTLRRGTTIAAVDVARRRHLNPARAWYNVKSNSSALDVSKLSHLVLDEADLLLSYGYEEDLENLSWSIPKGIQTVMMSATLTDEVDSLKKIFYRSNVPALLDLEEPDAEGEGVTQLVTKCGEDEKFLLAYVIFKLQLVKGKCIIFVGDVDRCYRLKLFFEQFGIRSCILNSELPVNSRLHVVEEFNRNVYDIIIASDEKEILGNEEKADEEKGGEEAQEEGEDEDGEKQSQRPQKKRKMSKRDKEYGVSRGIDFKNVAAVINFDLPTSASSYTHRIGRTARAGKAGMALSFAVPKDLYRKHMPTTTATAENDEKVLARITRQQAKKGKEIKPYNFNTKEVDAFRYRMNDALRAVTKVAVREARTRELRQELLKSEKLKRYFEENPSEINHLRHDGELRTARQQAHLKHIPDYLLPKEGKKALTEDDIGFVPLRKGGKARGHRKGKGTNKRGGFRAGGRKSDPLKTFKARRKTK